MEHCQSKNEIKEAISDFVGDYQKHFGSYPAEVEVNGEVYDFDAYWKILDGTYKGETHR